MKKQIERALKSLKKAKPKAENCPYRPQYHFLAPALWMNDPNGTIFHDGKYHLFYQHNPYKNKWGSIHWGHASSEDLIRWKHLPIALAPSQSLGEKHCFSGCCVIDQGVPKVIYTKIGRIWEVLKGSEQWMAIGSKDLLKWKKSEYNPIMEDSLHGDESIRQWRDPYIWKEQGVWYCLLSGHYRWRHRGVILLYRSHDLINWEYLGPLYEGKKEHGWCYECPNFFPLKDKHILVVSPFGKVRYAIGNYEHFRFTPEKWHYLDHGKAFYATNTLIDEKQRLILFGWIKGGGQGWNGCISFPRHLSLEGGTLKMRPIPEIEQLRERKLNLRSSDWKLNETLPINCTNPSQMEIKFGAKMKTSQKDRFGLRLLNCQKIIEVGYDTAQQKIFIGNEEGKINHPQEIMEFHLLLDNSVIEMFVNDEESIIGHFYPKIKNALQIQIFSEKEGINIKELSVWSLKSIW
ncbi:MAG: hypothetical protein EU544_02015 [Promethearchaeota archaeon]|nr:MAG: hypothetical protein EU544_02015 [Candidatus Lokiarchaeota archaeon]